MKARGTSKLSLLGAWSIVVLLSYIKSANRLIKRVWCVVSTSFFGPERQLILDFCELVTGEEDL